MVRFVRDFETMTLERRVAFDDPDHRDGEWLDRPAVLPINVEIHRRPGAAGILINYPGYGGSIRGYEDKYVRIARRLARLDVAATVRLENLPVVGLDYRRSLIGNLRHMIEWTHTHSKALCGRRDAPIYLSGTSAGASAAALIAHEYPIVEKMLLVCPSGDAGRSDAIAAGLSQFRGKLSVISGKADKVIPTDYVRYLFEIASETSNKNAALIADCDHDFRGPVNGYLFRRAPLWAFADADLRRLPTGSELL